MDWASAAARMDAAVDVKLGDDVQYAAGGGSFSTIKAFVIPAFSEDDFTAAAIDELGGRMRLKVEKAIVPTVSPADRIKSDLIGPGVWRPSSKKPDTRGRYWLFDLQKA